MQVEDLVLVVNEKKPCGQWPLGQVEESYPDKNGVVRQVLVRISNSKLKRDARKLCLLEGACWREHYDVINLVEVILYQA